MASVVVGVMVVEVVSAEEEVVVPAEEVVVELDVVDSAISPPPQAAVAKSKAKAIVILWGYCITESLLKCETPQGVYGQSTARRLEC